LSGTFSNNRKDLHVHIDSRSTFEKFQDMPTGQFSTQSSFFLDQHNMQFQKYPYSPMEGIEILLGVGALEDQKCKKCMKLNWNFQRGGEVLEKNSFCGGSMDVF